MPVSNLQYAEMLTRLENSTRSRHHPSVRERASGVEKESTLHEQILQVCKNNGWIALHGSMRHQTYRTIGENDFTCMLPRGRVLFVECKTRLSKLTPEQNAMRVWMASLGHTLHVVRSLQEFLVLAAGEASDGPDPTLAGKP